jgi:hypothetical protein
VLDGKLTLRATVRDVLPVAVNGVSHFFATLRTAAAPASPTLPPRARRLPLCVPPIPIRCAVD